jgi:hypothetical protein
MNPIKAGLPLVFADRALACPLCGATRLRPGPVCLFHNPRDLSHDGARPGFVIINSFVHDVRDIPGAIGRNPLPTGHGLLMHFHCEACDLLNTNVVLTVWEEEGATRVEWRPPPAASAKLAAAR